MVSLQIQPGEVAGTAVAAGQWTRGIPTPGTSGGVSASRGVASCANLLAFSPPTIVEAYDIASYSVAVAAAFGAASPFAAGTTIGLELAFLLNGSVVFAITENPAPVFLPAIDSIIANTTFTGDLVNPIRIAGPQTLALRLGFACSAAATSSRGVVAAALDQGGQDAAVESVFSYDSVELYAGANG